MVWVESSWKNGNGRKRLREPILTAWSLFEVVGIAAGPAGIGVAEKGPDFIDVVPIWGGP